MSNLELFDRIAGNVMCDILTDAGPALLNTGLWLLPTGLGTKVGTGFLGASAASYLAKNYLCDPIDVGDASPIPNVDGCQRVDGYGTAQINDGTGRWFNPFAGTELATKSSQAVAVTENKTVPRETGGYERITTWETTDGDITWSSFANVQPPQPAIARVLVTNGTCQIEGGTPQPLPPEVYQPREYTDPVDGCTFNVTFQGFVEVTPGGEVQPVLLIESAAEQRNDYGRMGGCVLAPTIYMPGGGGGGDGVEIPGPPGPPGPPVPPGGDEVPWWLPPLLAATTGALLNAILDAINDTSKKGMAAAAFTLTAPCDKDEKGEPLEAEWTFDEQPYFERIHDQQVVIMEILQQHLNFKTPICGNERPPKEGQWVTTRWISDQKMDHSNRRLRKLFRYRTKSTRDLGQLSAYWRDFTWEAGDVCVKHQGAWWGYPQVWAATPEEGKRVIRFAGIEAGLDPDQTGKWEIGGSDSPRYGMSGTMRIQKFEGYPWVAKRSGENWPNVLAQVSDPRVVLFSED